jgi:hypothetical protein
MCVVAEGEASGVGGKVFCWPPSDPQPASRLPAITKLTANGILSRINNLLYQLHFNGIE